MRSPLGMLSRMPLTDEIASTIVAVVSSKVQIPQTTTETQTPAGRARDALSPAFPSFKIRLLVAAPI